MRHPLSLAATHRLGDRRRRLRHEWRMRRLGQQKRFRRSRSPLPVAEIRRGFIHVAGFWLRPTKWTRATAHRQSHALVLLQLPHSRST